MKLAIKAINENQMGYLKASKVYNVLKSTLRRHLKGTNTHAKGGEKHFGQVEHGQLTAAN